MNKALFLAAVFCVALNACGQRIQFGEEYARQELSATLASDSLHNVIDNKELIIKDSVTAGQVVEPVLFGIYGKGNIIKQRPYETYLVDNYWVISGTLPKGYKGGTFLVILDSRNGRILKITHGK